MNRILQMNLKILKNIDLGCNYTMSEYIIYFPTFQPLRNGIFKCLFFVDGLVMNKINGSTYFKYKLSTLALDRILL